jgi:nitrous oxidase accessory protein
MDGVPAGAVEGRPRPEHTSPLQARIDEANSGDRIVVGPGTYRGDLLIDRAIVLEGVGRPLLVGSGTGTVVRIRAAGVVFRGFAIDGLAGGDLGRDSSGIHVSARNVQIEDCEVRNALFGIYLREADDSTVSQCSIQGIAGRPPGEVGSGIHVWNTNRFTLADNVITRSRDGIYIQASHHGRILRNRASDLRYGLHYMFSDDNTFEDNTFERGAAGTALMNSRRITFRRNRFVRNRGFASVGLLLKSCDEVVAEDNFIADNARGIFLESANRSVFRRNVIAMSDEAIVLYDSTSGTSFEGNVFVANFTPLTLVGRRTDTRFLGNFWSDQQATDLDGDGFADQAYRLSNVFDHLRGNLTAANLFARAPAAKALAAAERAFPVLEAVPVLDPRPLAHAPRLPPLAAEPHADSRSTASVIVAALVLVTGTLVLALGGRPPRAPRRVRIRERRVRASHP